MYLYPPMNNIRVYEQKMTNGLHCLYLHRPGQRVFHGGLIINCGTRDEQDQIHGMAHFIEHGLFKGTARRKTHHILNRLDSVGGEINAFTTKEITAVHSAVPSKYARRSIELIMDIGFNSAFPEKEMEKEKEVIIDEIYSYRDSPTELIYDDFEDLVFKGHPIGKNILGTPESVKHISHEELIRFYTKFYNPANAVFVGIGNINADRFFKYVSEFNTKPTKGSNPVRKPFNTYNPEHVTVEKPISQFHCMLGRPAYSGKNIKRWPLALLTNYLGGPSMNARLSMILREKHGIAYNVESNYSIYSDSGLFGVYFGTEPKKEDKALKLVREEFERLIHTPVTNYQLNRMKTQFTGQLALSREHLSSLLIAYGRNQLLFNRLFSLDEIEQEIQQLTPADLQQVSAEMLSWDQLTRLSFKPV